MDACPDWLGSSILPVQEGLVRSHPAAGPDAGDALGPDEAEDVFSLQGVVERDDSHPVTTAVLLGRLPGEPSVSLPPGQEISLALKVVVASAGGGDGLNPELVKLDGLARTLARGDGEGDDVS